MEEAFDSDCSSQSVGLVEMHPAWGAVSSQMVHETCTRIALMTLAIVTILGSSVPYVSETRQASLFADSLASAL